MKNLIYSLLLLLLVVGCNSRPKSETVTPETSVETTETTTATPIDTTAADKPAAELYACPMHPEVKGKKGEKCSKCGMDLTEPVKS